MSIALVTGASGFVGSHLVRRLAADDVPFRALVRTEGQACRIETLHGRPFLADLERPSTLRGLSDDVDVVYHCAGKLDLWGPAAAFRSVNVHGLEALLAECARVGRRPRFVHVSTASVHADPLPPVASESLPLSDSSEPYVASKVEAEGLVHLAHVEGTVEATVLRPMHIYGPRSQIVTEAAARIRSGKRTLIDFDGGTMPVVYVGNLVAAILCAGRASTATGDAYFVADDADVTWNDFVEELARASLLSLNPRTIPPHVATLAGMLLETAYGLSRVRRRPPIVRSFVRMIALHTRFSSEKAKRELGFRPSHDFRSGMRETGRWLMKQGTPRSPRWRTP
jgi:nucleoside-diphosphate-sugar epimerase